MLVPKIEQNVLVSENSELTRVIEIDSINIKPEFYDVDNALDDKERDKFIKYVEKIVRKSPEYKTYIGFLKNELNLTKCTFMPQIDINEIKNVGLEFHHYPFTLYDLVSIIVDNKIINNEIKLDPFLISEEIMKLHYENVVGLVPLSKTVHELVHAGKLFIPLNYVFGNYEKFLNKYNWNINGFGDKLGIIKQMSENIENGQDNDLFSIQKIFTEINVKDIETPKYIEVEKLEYA